ncbi:MAG TPA: diaminopimelate epimerase [Blastocatellia bacterium]|nr:diaminopimelate epimerase [Blastocatellia bacterium]
MSDLKFTKAQGMGNDFLIIEVSDVAPLPAASELARRMCERNYGAGADGLVFVARARGNDADFASRIFNADGSEAGVSGNGTRCAAAFLYHQGYWNQTEIRIETAAGLKRGRLVSRAGQRFEFEFDMGTPELSSASVPMSVSPSLDRVVRYPLRLGGDVLEVTCLSMGNPQCVIFVSGLESVNLDEIGPLIEHHPIFPDRANVEFAQVISRDEIKIRIWERGAGHTLSSGTGSCASAVAGALNGLTDRRVRVRTEGGPLRVNWRDDDRVLLTASADVVYEGRWLGE